MIAWVIVRVWTREQQAERKQVSTAAQMTRPTWQQLSPSTDLIQIAKSLELPVLALDGDVKLARKKKAQTPQR
jgi:hypothetical protein